MKAVEISINALQFHKLDRGHFIALPEGHLPSLAIGQKIVVRGPGSSHLPARVVLKRQRSSPRYLVISDHAMFVAALAA